MAVPWSVWDGFPMFPLNQDRKPTPPPSSSTPSAAHRPRLYGSGPCRRAGRQPRRDGTGAASTFGVERPGRRAEDPMNLMDDPTLKTHEKTTIDTEPIWMV